MGSMSPNNDNQEPQRTIDERIEALTGSFEQINAIAKEHAFSLKLYAEMIVSLDAKLEHLTDKIDKLSEDSKRDAKNIRTLVRIAEIRDRRLTAVEGDRPAQ